MSKKYSSVDIAKQIVIGYFESLSNKETINIIGLQELLAIKYDETNKVLLEHCKAIRNIMEDAIKDLESEDT